MNKELDSILAGIMSPDMKIEKVGFSSEPKKQEGKESNRPDIKSKEYTSIRANKYLLALVRLIFPDLNFTAIIEKLLKDCIRLNRDKIMSRYKKLDASFFDNQH